MKRSLRVAALESPFSLHICVEVLGISFMCRFHETSRKVRNGPSKTFQIKLFGGKAENGPYKMAFCFVKYLARPFKEGTFSLERTANTAGEYYNKEHLLHDILSMWNLTLKGS